MCKIKVDKAGKMCQPVSIPQKMMFSMKRSAIQALKVWKASEDRKPMMLKGARQVRPLF